MALLSGLLLMLLFIVAVADTYCYSTICFVILRRALVFMWTAAVVVVVFVLCILCHLVPLPVLVLVHLLVLVLEMGTIIVVAGETTR